MGIALALAASAAFATHPQTINKTGFVGVNKTQSAQSLGHSKLAFYALMDATNDISHLKKDGLNELYFGKTRRAMATRRWQRCVVVLSRMTISH